jgi:hypothetical protein
MAVTANTPIPTPSGWKIAHDIQKDDIVFDQYGNQVIVRTTQVSDVDKCYEVTLDDGLTIRGDKNLKLILQDKTWRDKMSNNKKKTTKCRMIHKTLEELMDSPLVLPSNSKMYSLPTCMPVKYNTKDLPVPAYVFAVWYASSTKIGRMWVNKRPIEKMRKIFRGYGFSIVTKKHRNGHFTFDIRPSVRDSFLFAGADIPNSIPLGYAQASVEQRIELLEGFCDANRIRFNSARSKWELRSPNYHFMRTMQGIIESLGMKTTMHSPFKGLYYTLAFNKNYDKPIVYGKNRRFVVKVEEIDAEKCVFIDTGTQILVGEGYLPIC